MNYRSAGNSFRYKLFTPAQKSSKEKVPYEYEPFVEKNEEIRLLTLCPGRYPAEIKILINHVPFTPNDTPLYEALSYTWGSSAATINIKVGVQETETLSISKNLAIALSRLRYRDRTRIFWVDAICINQQDLQERGHQVKMMGEIYARANRVVVWLGPRADGSTHAMHLIKLVASNVEVDWHNFTMKPTSLSADKTHWADLKKSFPFTRLQYQALDMLMQRHWFDRLWIRQEIALANSQALVVCGAATVSWENFQTAIFALASKPIYHNIFPDARLKRFSLRAHHITQLGHGNSYSPTWQLLRRAATSKCSDARDKIYGMLALIQNAEGPIEIEPDYSLSIPEVYQNLVLCFLNFHKRLDLLRGCTIDKGSPGMPSWTPKWSSSWIHLDKVWSDANCVANAQYLGNGVLRADGIFAATLKTTEILAESLKASNWCSEIHRIAPSDVMSASYYCGGSLLDAFQRTLCVNIFAETRPNYGNALPLQSSKEALCRILDSRPGRWPKFGEDTAGGDLLRLFDIQMRGRCFFTTIEGFIGLAPKDAMPGDIVGVLLGCEPPLLLRPVGNAQYQVVGECYMDGVMDSELILGPFPRNCQRRVHLNDSGWWQSVFVDTRTGKFEDKDPRLFLKFGVDIPLERIGTSWYHPSLTTQRLKEVGINITSFDLV